MGDSPYCGRISRSEAYKNASFAGNLIPGNIHASICTIVHVRDIEAIRYIRSFSFPDNHPKQARIYLRVELVNFSHFLILMKSLFSLIQ